MKMVINWKKILLYGSLSFSLFILSFINIQWFRYPIGLFARSIMNEIYIIFPCFGGQFIVDISIALVIGSLPILFGIGSFISQSKNYKQMLLLEVIGLLCGFLGIIGRVIFIIHQYESIDFRELNLYDFFGYGMLLGVIICSLLIRKYNQVNLIE